MARTYRKKDRAKAQDRTRSRIVEAAIRLHQAKGVNATSMRDVAAEAGVGIVTVYRHFADPHALLGACSGTYFARNPPPEPEDWRREVDPLARARLGITETYAYHRQTAQMIARVMPELAGSAVAAPYDAHWARAVDVLRDAWPAPACDARALRAALDLALWFGTWQRLTTQEGLDDAAAVSVAMRLLP